MQKLKSEEKITQFILDNFSNCTVPWRPGYTTNAPSIVTPIRNNGEYYRGINVLVLMSSSIQQEFTCPFWITFKQCMAEGGNLKGQKGTRIIKYGTTEIEGRKPEDDPRKISYLRAYSVFNIEQATGLPDDFVERRTVAEPCTHSLHELVEACGVTLLHGSNEGVYYPDYDQIRLPNKSNYVDDDAYAATLAHELVHATGHPQRLARDLNQDDDKIKSFEELIAEIGSAFLLNRLNIPSSLEDRTVPYIKSWLKHMESDPKYILKAASAAQKAIDCIFSSVESASKKEAVA